MWIQILTIVFIWLAFVFGVYIYYYLIRYMKDKPLGLQSLLDILYSQLLKLVVGTAFMVCMNYTLILIKCQSWPLAIIFGYGTWIFIIGGITHFILCGVFRFMLICFPLRMEALSEKQIETGIW